LLQATTPSDRRDANGGKIPPPKICRVPELTAPTQIAVSRNAHVDQRPFQLPPTPPSSTSSSERVIRKKTATVSLFPDPARLQQKKDAPRLRIRIPSLRLRADAAAPESATASAESSSAIKSTKGSRFGATTPPDEKRKGLARARERAHARKVDDQSPIFDDLKPKRQTKQQKEQAPQDRNGTYLSCLTNGLVDPTPAKSSQTDVSPSVTIPVPPGEIKRRSSIRKSRNCYDSDNYTIDSVIPSTILTFDLSELPPIPSTENIAAVQRPELKPEKATRRLQTVLDKRLLQSGHIRQSASMSSIASQSRSGHIRQSASMSSISAPCNSSSAFSPSPGMSSDDNTDSTSKRCGRSHSTSRLPRGIAPQDAAKTLPSSVKTALSLHAQSESMGYSILLPHEVVQLNEVPPRNDDN
jgi:hypothetical protein